MVMIRGCVLFWFPAIMPSHNDSAVHSHIPMSPSSIIWYEPKGGNALQLASRWPCITASVCAWPIIRDTSSLPMLNYSTVFTYSPNGSGYISRRLADWHMQLNIILFIKWRYEMTSVCGDYTTWSLAKSFSQFFIVAECYKMTQDRDYNRHYKSTVSLKTKKTNLQPLTYELFLLFNDNVGQ